MLSLKTSQTLTACWLDVITSANRTHITCILYRGGDMRAKMSGV
jgi:hypothetical protein